jgi:hypothetical protein
MNKEIAERPKSEAPIVPYEAMAPEILKTDLVVPYLTLGQGLSQAVIDRKVQLGDIYRSTTGEKLGDPEHPVDVIFLSQPKPDWVLEQKGKSKFEYRKSEARHAKNETLPWSFYADDDGNMQQEAPAKGLTEWRRVKRLTVFAILTKDIEAFQAEIKKVDAGELPDPSKALTPVAISFRSTGYNTGKAIGMFGAKAHTLRAHIWRYQVSLWDSLEQNDSGSFYVWQADTVKVKPVPKDYLPFIEQWVAMMATTDVAVHEEGDGGVVAPQREVSEKIKREVC